MFCACDDPDTLDVCVTHQLLFHVTSLHKMVEHAWVSLYYHYVFTLCLCISLYVCMLYLCISISSISLYVCMLYLCISMSSISLHYIFVYLYMFVYCIFVHLYLLYLYMFVYCIFVYLYLLCLYTMFSFVLSNLQDIHPAIILANAWFHNLDIMHRYIAAIVILHCIQHTSYQSLQCIFLLCVGLI